MNKFKQISVCIILASIALLVASCGGGKPNYKAKLKNDADSACYFLGYYYGTSFANSDIDDFNIDAMAKGVQEALKKGKEVDQEKMQELQMFLNNYFMNLQSRTSEKAMKEGQDWLDANKKKQGVVTLPSGLQYKIIKDGSGAKPTKEDMVEVEYKGSLIDGTEFDNSERHGGPVPFNLNGGAIEGFIEALTLMSEGSIWEVYIPSELGYGDMNRGGPIPPNSVLIFEINLVKIKPQE